MIGTTPFTYQNQYNTFLHVTFYIYLTLYLLYTQHSYFPFLVFHKCNNLTIAKFHLLTPHSLCKCCPIFLFLHMFSASLYRVFIFALVNYLSFKQVMRRKEKESYFPLFIISSDHFFPWIQVSIWYHFSLAWRISFRILLLYSSTNNKFS